jgi:hypothetical protein
MLIGGVGGGGDFGEGGVGVSHGHRSIVGQGDGPEEEYGDREREIWMRLTDREIR